MDLAPGQQPPAAAADVAEKVMRRVEIAKVRTSALELICTLLTLCRLLEISKIASLLPVSKLVMAGKTEPYEASNRK